MTLIGMTQLQFHYNLHLFPLYPAISLSVYFSLSLSLMLSPSPSLSSPSHAYTLPLKLVTALKSNTLLTVSFLIILYTYHIMLLINCCSRCWSSGRLSHGHHQPSCSDDGHHLVHRHGARDSQATERPGQET